MTRPLRKRPTGTETEKTPLLGDQTVTGDRGPTPPVHLDQSKDKTPSLSYHY